MIKLLNVTGLVLGLIGVILLFRYGMPYQIRTEGKTPITKMLPGASNTIERERRYNRLGWLGLLLICLGTGLQIAATLMSQ